MADQVAISSLSDLTERLFTKPPAVQGVSVESAVRYLNAAAGEIGENLIQQLLVSEHCNTHKDQREFNEHVTTGTLLHVLAFVGRSEAVEWLLKNGANSHTFNHVGSTALHVAALRQHADIIRSLRFYHADSYSENKDCKTALDFGQEADDVKEALLSYRFSSESIEEEFLHERLPALMERVKTPKDSEDQMQALLCIRAEIRMATSSMTSVPKPLKFLREHLDELELCYSNLATSSPSKKLLADVLSVLAMAVDDKTERKCLNYRLQGSQEKVSSFGHPYIRRLCSQIPEEWLKRSSPEADLDDLVTEICKYCLHYSAEAEACDLLMEIEKIERIVDLVTEDISDRVCLYLTSCVKYVQEPENTTLLKVALEIHKKFKQYPQALRLALMINDPDLIRSVFLECPDSIQTSPGVQEEERERLGAAAISHQRKFELGPQVDPTLLSELEDTNKTELAKLEEGIEDATKNFGETEQRDALMVKAEYLCKIGNKDAAVSALRAAFDKAVGLSHRMDITFYLIRVGLFFMDHDLITRNIEKAKSLIEEGGDWDRRNRLKTYEGLYCMSVRDFKKAAVCFFDTMATFTSTELMEYRSFVKYAVFCCLVAQDRGDIKKQIINGTDILEVLHDFPELKQYVHSLYYCQYDEFFRSLIWAEREFKCDRFLAPHSRYFIREMRIKAYTQLLESYRSLSLSHMAASFGVSVEFIDRELSKFIASGRLHCRIDKVGGVVETNRPDSKNFLYQSTIKQGDLLLNRVQKLSRVINM